MDTVDDVVVGGGIGGLTLAFRRHASGRSVRVLEAAEQAGGLLQTRHHHGVLIEQGPQSIQTTPALCRLIDDLDLQSAVVPPSPAASKRYLLQPDGLVALPHSLVSALQSPVWRRRAVLRALAEPLASKAPAYPESVRDWLVRRFGEGAIDPVLDAFVAGVFAGDPAKLDAEAAFGALVAVEREHGSLVRGMSAFAEAKRAALPDWAPKAMFALKGGNHTLVQRLTERLGSAVRCNEPVTAVSPRPKGGWLVRTPSLDVACRRVWLCVPLSVVSRLLPGFSARLRLPSAPIASVTLGYPTESVLPAPQGFGWLAPAAVRTDVLGCLWVSSAFPGHAPGHTVMRVMLGGTRAPQLLDLSSEELVAHARKVLTEVQGLRATPSFTDVAAYPRGIPQYPVGWARNIAGVQAALPGLRLAGWGAVGVGLSHAAREAEAAVALR